MFSGNAGISRRRLEPVEPPRKSVTIRAILDASRQMYGSTIQSLQSFEHRSIILTEQPIGDMQALVGVNADQMGVKSCVMDF
jgi:hypothetical protein